jgi:hypothetical protein
MGLLVGFIIAYPMNWWLVANHLKHGMMTVRPGIGRAGMERMTDDMTGGMANEMAGMAHGASAMSMGAGRPTRPPVPVMTLVSFVVLAAGLAVAFLLRRS